MSWKKKSRILAIPEAKTSSRRLTHDDKQHVIDFYISEKYSRQLSAVKSTKNMKQPNGKRIKVRRENSTCHGMTIMFLGRCCEI